MDSTERPAQMDAECGGGSQKGVGASVPLHHGDHTVEPLVFTSGRLQLAGLVCAPREVATPLPAIVVQSPFGQVKEQAPAEYATRLADKGFVVCVFDCAHHGDSAGEPRQLIDPTRRVGDLLAAIGAIAALPAVDAQRIALLGIGDGAAEAITAGAADERVGAVVAVAGRYRDPESDLTYVLGDEHREPNAESSRRLRARMERAQSAVRRFEQTGEVDYAPIVDVSRDDVALPGAMACEWFARHSGLGRWENRYALMGDVAYLTFESLSAATRLHVPLLMVEGMAAARSSAASRHFARVTSKKDLVELDGSSVFHYYDDPVTVDRATAQVARWLSALIAVDRPRA